MNFRNVKELFFENLGIRQTIFKNTFWLTVAEVMTRVLGLILIVYVARILGAAEYGKFAFALSFVSVVVILANLGLSEITTRELSREKEIEKEIEKEFSSIFSLKILLSIGALFLMLIGSFFITTDPVIQKVIWILAIFILISSFFSIIYAFLRARQKMEYEAGIKIFQYLIITGIGFLVLFKFPTVENLSYAYLFANLIVLIFVLSFFHSRIQSLRLSWNKVIWKKFLKMSWPLSLGFMLGWIYILIDSIMLGFFGKMIEVGWYNAASKITIITIIPATLISRSFYPVLSRFFKESREKLQSAWDYQIKLMIILALPVMTGGVALAPKIISFFYGPDFIPSILAFQFLIFVAGISFLYYPFAIALVVSNQQKKHFVLILAGILINIVLNFILIPKYNFLGAAVSTIITSFIIFLSAIFLLKYYTFISSFNLKLFKIFIIAVFLSAIMFVIIKHPVIYQFNFLITFSVGAIVYLSLFFLYNKVDKILVKAISM